ncbi:MAG: hypothetical protein ACQERZ_03870 [Fusobacteriota bacterium]
MKKVLLLLILLPFLTEASDWKYDNTEGDPRLYIHEVVNYNFNMNWDEVFQRKNYTNNLVRFSYGSISSKDLLDYEQLIINQNLDSKTWFRLYIDKYQGRYHEIGKDRRYVELHRKVGENIFISAFSDPDYKKHTVDIGCGILFINRDKSNYIHLNYIDEDFPYDKRNKIGGKTLKNPRGLMWTLSFEKDNKYIFSEGKFTKKFIREYSDIEKSPELKYHSQTNNFGTVAGGISLNKLDLYFKFDIYNIFDQKRFYNENRNYKYDKDIYIFRSNQIYPIGNELNLKVEMDYVYKKGNAKGYMNYNLIRTEKILGAFINKRIQKNILELGYFGSFINKEKNNFKEYSYIDKAILKWEYDFGPSRLQVSISHVLQLQGFGGGNIQYFLSF